MRLEIEHPIRAGLALAGVDAKRQGEIVSAVLNRLDRDSAIRRRNDALRRAFHLFAAGPGDARRLAEALREFSSRIYPGWRHLPTPPAYATPLRAALFEACQAADDAAAKLPDERQLRRIVS